SGIIPLRGSERSRRPQGTVWERRRLSAHSPSPREIEGPLGVDELVAKIEVESAQSRGGVVITLKAVRANKEENVRIGPDLGLRRLMWSIRIMLFTHELDA